MNGNGEVRKKQFTIVVDVEIHKAFKAVAVNRGESMTSMIEKFMKETVEKEN